MDTQKCWGIVGMKKPRLTGGCNTTPHKNQIAGIESGLLNPTRRRFCHHHSEIMRAPILILMFLLSCGCKPNPVRGAPEYQILIVDGCEYVAFNRSYASPLHKANCTNHTAKVLAPPF
jgi:hypothetical protein